MWIVLALLLPFLHHVSGCIPSDSGVLDLNAVSGDAVFLPCSCTEPYDKPNSSSWLTNSRTASAEQHYIDMVSVSELYRGRITRFNHTAPGNLSLLLSQLTRDDQGWYVCWINDVSRFINLTVKERSSPSIIKFSGRHHYIIICVLIIIIGGAAGIYCRYKISKVHKNKTDSRNGDTPNEQGQDEYCSMHYIPVLPKKCPEEVYATLDKIPEDQVYVSMMPQPDVKQ